MSKNNKIFAYKFEESCPSNKLKKKVLGWQRIKYQFYNQYCQKKNKKEEKSTNLARNTFPLKNNKQNRQSKLINTLENNFLQSSIDENKENRQSYRRTFDKARKQLQKKSEKSIRNSMLLTKCNLKQHQCVCVMSPIPCTFCQYNACDINLRPVTNQTTQAKKFHHIRLRSNCKSDISKNIDSLLKQCTKLWRDNSKQIFSKSIRACSYQFKKNLQDSTVKLDRALSCAANEV